MKKESGVLLHITSLPGKYGIGSMGKEAYKFIDFLDECGFSYWEILPLEATGYSNSPYFNCSAFGFNFYLIDIEDLINKGLLSSRDLRGLDFGDDPRRVDYLKLFKAKQTALRIAFKRFDTQNPEFIEFKKDKNRFEFALYSAIKDNNNSKARFDWRLEDRYYDEEVKSNYIKYHGKDIEFYFFEQFIFMKQYNALHLYAKSKGIDIIGDVPHFMAYDSDVMYFNPDLFLVDKRNLATFVAGFPPDDYRKEGQKRGYPLYDWEYMKLSNYKWWKARIYVASNMYDRFKLNHFRGFYKTYAIPFRSPNGKKGKFLDGPGLEFINDVFKGTKVIASFLGIYNKELEEFASKTNLTCLKTTLGNLFASEKDFREELLPSNIKENVYLYLENHDNAPIREVLKSTSGEIKNLAYDRLRSEGKKLNVPFDSNASSIELAHFLIELAFASKAEYVTLSFQDMIFSGKESRMNTPGVDSTLNWSYRFLDFEFSKRVVSYFKQLNSKYNRHK